MSLLRIASFLDAVHAAISLYRGHQLAAPLRVAGLATGLPRGKRPLRTAYAGEEKKQGWLLGYSSLTAYEIEAAMLRLGNALSK
ncbi:hypothetical protein HX794_29260 [Pseudomonas costantinii]|uniref:hypothetical protein n=1 Tax=Pseudomonas costantinii TaxID=168469 RepID=UPI00159F7693|nr:hypothetical protein [Pseudomonas costantinii]NVZ23743.1 hypothetical protein [Pseudomonas costantinii]